MAYLEIIKIQTQPNTEPALELVGSAVAADSDRDLLSCKILRNSDITNELMVILTWKTKRRPPWGSPLAQGLVQEFRRLGLVDHSVWSDLAEHSDRNPMLED